MTNGTNKFYVILMDSIYSFCEGESHRLCNKPCQDYAYADSSEGLSMAIVSDGHGGERYFRSDIGPSSSSI
ncbi:protein phosphatase 2C domain-containing protein [Phocaeicola vulgatus]|uniref:protein phosphatase 2C domain-containing protein n=1 Tax=Phocaeicola vulgatus TaxID=821 RepID=UPI0030B93F67